MGEAPMGAVKGACTLGEGSRHVQTRSSLTSGRTSASDRWQNAPREDAIDELVFHCLCILVWLPFVTRLFTIDPTSRQFLLNELTLRVFSVFTSCLFWIRGLSHFEGRPATMRGTWWRGSELGPVLGTETVPRDPPPSLSPSCRQH